MLNLKASAPALDPGEAISHSPGFERLSYQAAAPVYQLLILEEHARDIQHRSSKTLRLYRLLFVLSSIPVYGFDFHVIPRGIQCFPLDWDFI